MELLFPKATYGGIKRYLRRQRYRRLHGGAATGRRKIAIIQLRGPRRQWRMRTIPRLRWVLRSPLKILAKVKNVYINFMLRMAGNIGAVNSDKIFGVKRIPKAREVSKSYRGQEFEARLVFEISKTLVTSYELYPM
ncbi:unnamed protein product [Sphenostylis stenocarpa]|uniref:Uncharacterized protein n=1 Tax=Sphenostylis stenocarpa TaxID=92480 RepID=A0AA86S1M5_9FABA|nr:unnamed protein product [Sphenostylis stenocarpa]